jgi:hypothetical protein
MKLAGLSYLTKLQNRGNFLFIKSLSSDLNQFDSFYAGISQGRSVQKWP